MAYSEDHIVLAAEYALGTLDADERAQVETMMVVDKKFAAVVQAWQFRLDPLNQVVGSVEPRPIVWEGICAATGHAAPQEPLLLPDVPPPPPRVEPEAVQTPLVEDVALASRVKRWRRVALLASAIAAALAAMLALQVYQPGALPGAIRPNPQMGTGEVNTPAPAVVPSSEHIALLQGQNGGPAFILTIDSATKHFTVHKLDAPLEPGKSFELWLMSDKLPRPQSLGVIGDSDFTASEVLVSYDAAIINDATYAVTVEQAGGSPSGEPTSAPVFSGKLIETVPPAQK
jgi:anti-sigma-K factor RskA